MGKAGRIGLIGYVGLLGVSLLFGLVREVPDARSSADRVVEVAELGHSEIGVEIAVREIDSDLEGPVLVLLHGSPGSSADFDRLAEQAVLDGRRILIPDLPGFGRSTREVADYSVAAHARYLLALIDELGIAELDLVGYSMGGGVALEFANLAPERVRSIVLMSAIGVQELELFGDYELNHLVHGAQLVGVRVLPWVIPHFGSWTGQFFGEPYARNFFDTDQRRLRSALEQWDGPMLIAHGEDDFLVPVEAAREHFRIVPQSELELLEHGHFFLFADPQPVARAIGAFLRRVDRGEATTRSSADPHRVAQSQAAFDPGGVPKLAGPGLLLLLVLIALATFISEDLTCIGAGLLVAQGRIDLFPAVCACFLGILIGDMLLYLAGRALGRPALTHAPLSWFVKAEAVDRAAVWFEARGGRVVFLSRFVPGLRLPTYVAAGVLRQPFLSFALFFVLAGLVWTPLFVAIASWAGTEAREFVRVFESWAMPVLVTLVLGLLALQRFLLPAFTYRGRRMLAGKWMRLRRWEYWSPLVFYLPVVAWIIWLAIKHRSLALVTAANPGIPTGGFIGESKSAILDSLRDQEGRVARFCLLRAEIDIDERKRIAHDFLSEQSLAFPIVLKPDVGHRGLGVRILKDSASLEGALENMRVDSILQEFIAGREYGVFYLRKPSERQGQIFSITEKVLPVVRGDGISSIEELIFSDSRAIAQANAYLDGNSERLGEVPPVGREVQLVELGTHCRGAMFLDGCDLATDQLHEVVEAISLRFDGFYFGRYDVIAESEDAFRAGQFRVIELNGLTAEATHIYQPGFPLLGAYRVLFEQWRFAFEIAEECRASGTKPDSLFDLLRETLAYRRLARVS